MENERDLPRKVEVIIKVTDHCNLRCEYCFDAKSRKQGLTIDCTTIQSLPRLFSVLKTKYDEVDIIFHGGEPFLASPKVFEDIMDVLDPFAAYYHVQTNLSQDSLEKFDVVLNRLSGLSFSLDGPEELHNSQRVRADSSGSYSLIIKNLKWLRETHPKLILGVLCTLSSKSIPYYGELYPYFKRLKVTRIGFNPVFKNGESLSNEGYYKILEAMFTEWVVDPNPLDISLFVEALKWTTGIQETPSFCFGQNCYSDIISISPNGNINPCLHWHDDETFSVHEFTSFDPYLKYYKQKFAPFAKKECTVCQFWTFCRGGCPHEYLNEKWYFCEAINNLMLLVTNFISSTIKSPQKKA